jgi:hypothetical protein
MEKHSSLFGRSFSNEKNPFYNVVNRSHKLVKKMKEQKREKVEKKRRNRKTRLANIQRIQNIIKCGPEAVAESVEHLTKRLRSVGKDYWLKVN